MFQFLSLAIPTLFQLPTDQGFELGYYYSFIRQVSFDQTSLNV